MVSTSRSSSSSSSTVDNKNNNKDSEIMVIEQQQQQQQGMATITTVEDEEEEEKKDIKQLELNESLMVAVKANDINETKKYLKLGAHAYYQELQRGTSVLMIASQLNNMEMVDLLLVNGAPWNALDRYNKCAGEYAMLGINNDSLLPNQDIIDRLVNHAVISEMLLGNIEKKLLFKNERIRNNGATMESRTYLDRQVSYQSKQGKNENENENENENINNHDDHMTSKGQLLDNNDDGVMMEWETPLMKAHADLLCNTNNNNSNNNNIPSYERDILNVGFGMGIIDGFIQENNVKSHTIIEAHPEVYKKMIADGWDQKPNVTILFGRWQDCIKNDIIRSNIKFDGIFFDTYAEHFTDMEEFHSFLPQLLKPNGRGQYSYFNGLAPDNIFFHGVACEIIKISLRDLNITCDFINVEFDTVEDDSIWDGVKRKYWHNRKEYYLPICMNMNQEEEDNDKKEKEKEKEKDFNNVEKDEEICVDNVVGNSENKNEVEEKEDKNLASNTHRKVDMVDGDVFENSTCDETLMAEAELPDGTIQEIMLGSKLNPHAGGLSWEPIGGSISEQQQQQEDPKVISHLRTWFPPMLNDIKRNQYYENAIKQAIYDFKLKHDGESPIVLDIGSGTGFLSMLAVRHGANHVYACEGFKALIPLSKEIIAKNHMSSKITVIGKRSTDIVIGVDIPEKCDMIISEILDHSLIGEGMLPSLRDARQRLLKPDAISIPSSAIIYGRLIEADGLTNMNKNNTTHNVNTNNLCDHRSLIPLQVGQYDQKRKWLSDSMPIFQFDFNSKTIADDITSDNVSDKHILVTEAGKLHGIVFYWSLNIYNNDNYHYAYSTDPDNGYFQDHWWQTVWTFQEKKLKSGDHVSIRSMHNDLDFWCTSTVLKKNNTTTQCIKSNEIEDSSAVLLKRFRGENHVKREECTCGWHRFLSLERIMVINDNNRNMEFESAISNVLKVQQQKDLSKVINCLDISDGSFTGLLALQINKRIDTNLKIISLEDNTTSHSIVKSIASNEKDFISWAGAAKGEMWEWDMVDVLMGDAYYHQMRDRPLWGALNFWYLRTAVDTILNTGVSIIPHKARIMAAVVEFTDLAKGHQEIKNEFVCDLKHEPFITLQKEARENMDTPINIAMYKHQFLTEPTQIMTFDYTKAIDFASENNIKLEGSMSTTVTGNGHAILIWVDLALNPNEKDVFLKGNALLGSKQMIRWLPTTEGKLIKDISKLSYSAICHLDKGEYEFTFDVSS